MDIPSIPIKYMLAKLFPASKPTPIKKWRKENNMPFKPSGRRAKDSSVKMESVPTI